MPRLTQHLISFDTAKEQGLARVKSPHWTQDAWIDLTGEIPMLHVVEDDGEVPILIRSDSPLWVAYNDPMFS